MSVSAFESVSGRRWRRLEDPPWLVCLGGDCFVRADATASGRAFYVNGRPVAGLHRVEAGDLVLVESQEKISSLVVGACGASTFLASGEGERCGYTGLSMPAGGQAVRCGRCRVAFDGRVAGELGLVPALRGLPQGWGGAGASGGAAVSGQTVLVAGCGTVNYHLVAALGVSAAGGDVRRLVLVDRARIREVNGVTCPGFAGNVGEAKVTRLAALAAHEGWQVECLQADVGRLAQLPLGREDECVTAFIGLDCWGARMAVCQRLREHVASTGAEAVAIILAVDRGRFQVSVLGGHYRDPCPACGLDPPGSEPCVVFDGEGRLVRGDLRREAEGAAAIALRAFRDIVTGEPMAETRWVGWQMHGTMAPDERDFRIDRLRCLRQADCAGPHGPAMSSDWERALEALGATGGT